MNPLTSSPRTRGVRTPSNTLVDAIGQRRLALAATTRTARIVAKIAGVFILLIAFLFATLLSGLGLWTPNVSFVPVAGALVSAIVASWMGAVLLQTAPLAAKLFAVPMALGLAFAAFGRHWWACAILLACILIPFAALALYQVDKRKTP